MTMDIGDLSKMPFPEASLAAHRMELNFYGNRDVCWNIIATAMVNCRFWGVDKNRVIVLMVGGRLLLTVEVDNWVMVNFVPCRFVSYTAGMDWMFCTSRFKATKMFLEPLSTYLKKNMDKQASFDLIFKGDLA